ncbi:MAG: tRNA 4-thiouridine(8) synthase ThiI [DPANN group archaeon]|nr:tRNA 4-thiouridine(8) synthase ThiI [DPANN group archaeon]
MNNCILLRYGEIGLKSKRTRPAFEKLYIKSIKDALTRNYIENFEIKNLGGRFVVYCKAVDEAIQVLKRVAGIQSVSSAKKIDFSSKKYLIKKIKAVANSLVKKKTFGVKVKRVGTHNFDSMALARDVGEVLYKASKGVDLNNPEINVNLEVRNKECFFYTSTIKGVGGLPAGSSEKVLCLFSGGIDSPVAAFQMIKRGCRVDFLFLNIMGKKLLNDVTRVYNFLITNYAFGYIPKLYVVDGKEIIKSLKKDVPDTLRQIAYKIVLYKIGELIAKKYDYASLVSGESLAQKSSQTLKSLLFIENQVSIHMLRPLLSFDKLDITKIAKKLGTLSSSEKIKEYCNLSEGPVTTAPRESDIKKIPSFKNEISKTIKKISITKGVLEIKETPTLKLPKTQTIVTVDLRSEIIQKKIPLNTNLKVPYNEVFDQFNEFKKGKNYLLICSFGVRSEDIASELRTRGIKATGISSQDFVKNFSKKK